MALLFEWRDGVEAADELSATDRHVALVIAGHMDKNGAGAYPGVRTIARKAARKTHTIAESIAWLEASGWLRIERRHVPGKLEHDTNLYTATVPTARRSKTDRAAWLKSRKVVPEGTPQVGTQEAPPTESGEVVPIGDKVVPEEDGGVSPSVLEVVPREATELPQTYPMNYTTNSPLRAVQEDGVEPGVADAVDDRQSKYDRASVEDLQRIVNLHEPDSESHRRATRALERKCSASANTLQEIAPLGDLAA